MTERYRFVENSPRSAVPVLELIPGQRGTIQYVAFYPVESRLHTDRYPVRIGEYIRGKTNIGDLTDSELVRLASEARVPQDELVELRGLAKSNSRRLKEIVEERTKGRLREPHRLDRYLVIGTERRG